MWGAVRKFLFGEKVQETGIKRAIVHIGLAKTGTTSVQFSLARSRNKLARRGWIYPKLGTTTSESGHHGFAWHLQGATHQHPGLMTFDVEKFRAFIASSQNKNVIISSEELSALSYSQPKISALIGFFPAHDVHVVAYAREQAELVNSFYGEILSSLSDPGTIDDFSARIQTANQFNYERLFRIWANVLGPKMLVRPFDSGYLRSGDIVEDFATLAQIPLIFKKSGDSRKNAGYNTLQIGMLKGLVRRINASNPNLQRYSKPYRSLRRIVSQIISGAEFQNAEAYWGLSPERTQTLRLHYHDSNKTFFEKALGKPFQFKAVSSTPQCNDVRYEDVPRELRQRAEETLTLALEKIDRRSRWDIRT